MRPFANREFRVVGMIDATDPDQDESVFVPLTTLQQVLGMRHLQTIDVSIEQSGEATRVAAEITRILRERHTRPVVMRGREMQGWIRVDGEGVKTKRELQRWVSRGIAYARSLPAKR